MALQIDERAKEILDTLIAKEPIELNAANIAFLKARRDYLSTKQLAKFAGILNAKTPKVKEPGQSVDEIVAGENVANLSYKELQRANKALGLQCVGISRADLEANLSTKLGPEASGHPE